MEKHFTITDSQFEKQFAAGTLNPTLFTHEAHLRLAWIHIKKYGVDEAIQNISPQIKAFAKAQGDHDKFNVTVTIAAIRAVYHFVLKSESDNFHNFILEFPKLKTSFKNLLGSHYSENIFDSEMAKRKYLAPDLFPFDEINSGTK